MTSFARSGETLLLRHLNEHSAIVVLHQIARHDHKQDKKLFRAIMRHSGASIRPPEGFLMRKRKSGAKILLVKHGVWNHQFRHRGFVLARNPFAVVASMLRYSRTHQESEGHRRGRLARWAAGLDPALVEMASTANEVEALSHLYVSKMRRAAESGHMVVRYEDFVRDPEAALRRIIDNLGLRWNCRVLTAEQSYSAGEIGHGGCDLAAPIRFQDAAYAGDLTEAQFERVLEITSPVLPYFGYRAIDGTVEVVASLGASLEARTA